MSTKESAPPYDALLEKLYVDDIVDAIKIWSVYCTAGGNCSRGYHKQTSPHLYCANMLHASLLGKAMGGESAEHENYHLQAQKVEQWILEQEAC